MKKKGKKETTNDELARMVQNGFSAVDQRFDAVDKQFDTVSREFQVVHHKIDTLARRVDVLVDQGKRIARLERLVDSLLKR